MFASSSPLDSSQPAEDSPAPPPTWPTTLAGRVLVAEDYRPSQLVAEFFLEKLGLEVDLASNGEETLAALTLGQYDVVLLDLFMPGVNGLEVARRVRAGEVPGCPTDMCLIATTTHATAVEREKALAVGITDFLAKPFDLHQLAHYLRPWLCKDRRREAGVSSSEEAEEHQNKPNEEGFPRETAPIFDYPQLFQALRGNTALFASYVEGFIRHSMEEMANARRAAAEGDGPALRHVLHNWTGACGYLRAQPMLEAIEPLAQAAREGHREAMQALWPKVERAMQQLHQALQQAKEDTPAR